MQNERSTDIILVDIIGFSKLEDKQQLEIITYLTKSYTKMIQKMLSNSNMELNKLIVGFIPTGDGFFCILNTVLRGYGTMLALSFNYISEQISNKYSYFKGVKIAVHTGKVYEFKDILGNKNFIGNGLNDCARYLETKNYAVSTVMVSDSAFEYFKKFLQSHKDFETLLSKRELKYSKKHIFEDKHGNKKSGCFVWLRQGGIINPPVINIRLSNLRRSV